MKNPLEKYFQHLLFKIGSIIIIHYNQFHIVASLLKRILFYNLRSPTLIDIAVISLNFLNQIFYFLVVISMLETRYIYI